LRHVDKPIGPGEAGAAVGLHPNTARVHLELLCSAGLLERRTEDRTKRGRPRVLYEVGPSARRLGRDGRTREAEVGYRDLARLVARQLSELPDVPSEAVRAGRRWASVLDKVHLSTERLSATETIRAAAEVLDRLGFDPEPDVGALRILLRRCPFLEVASESRSVVCGIHLGMLKATVERLDSPVDVAGLEPPVTLQPTVCMVRFATRPARQ
jgi:predicted ArsR family transcriptional regulator